MPSILVIINAPKENGWFAANGQYLEVDSVVFGPSDPIWDKLDEYDRQDYLSSPRYCLLQTEGNKNTIEYMSRKTRWSDLRSFYQKGTLKIRVDHTLPAGMDNEDFLNFLPSIEDLRE